jgi:hypothetical protein
MYTVEIIGLANNKGGKAAGSYNTSSEEAQIAMTAVNPCPIVPLVHLLSTTSLIPLYGLDGAKSSAYRRELPSSISLGLNLLSSISTGAKITAFMR